MKDGLDPVLDVDQVPDFLQLLLLLDVRSVEGEGQQVNRDAEDDDARADDAKLEKNSFPELYFDGRNILSSKALPCLARQLK